MALKLHRTRCRATVDRPDHPLELLTCRSNGHRLERPSVDRRDCTTGRGLRRLGRPSTAAQKTESNKQRSESEGGASSPERQALARKPRCRVVRARGRSSRRPIPDWFSIRHRAHPTTGWRNIIHISHGDDIRDDHSHHAPKLPSAAADNARHARQQMPNRSKLTQKERRRYRSVSAAAGHAVGRASATDATQLASARPIPNAHRTQHGRARCLIPGRLRNQWSGVHRDRALGSTNCCAAVRRCGLPSQKFGSAPCVWPLGNRRHRGCLREGVAGQSISPSARARLTASARLCTPSFL